MGCVQNQHHPQWVIDMTNARFKSGKGNKDNAESRCYFCVECGGQSLTQIDVLTKHKGHKVLRAFSCSREYGYYYNDVDNIRGLLDVSGICRYKTNGRCVLFPRSRKKEEDSQKSSLKIKCVGCNADLPDVKDRFCSLLCKLETPGAGLVTLNGRMLHKNQICLSVFDKKGLKRSRKGIPRRAPFF